MSIWTQLWIVWGVMFGVVEGAALFTKTPGATLTAHVVKWMSLKNKSWGWVGRRGGLIGFLGWLTYHFLSRIEW